MESKVSEQIATAVKSAEVSLDAALTERMQVLVGKIDENAKVNLIKVVNKLKSLQINYYISEELMEFENNNYFQMLEKSKTYHLLMRDVDDIYNYLVSNIERKYIKRIINKIKEVIDEG